MRKSLEEIEEDNIRQSIMSDQIKFQLVPNDSFHAYETRLTMYGMEYHAMLVRMDNGKWCVYKYRARTPVESKPEIVISFVDAKNNVRNWLISEME